MSITPNEISRNWDLVAGVCLQRTQEHSSSSMFSPLPDVKPLSPPFTNQEETSTNMNKYIQRVACKTLFLQDNINIEYVAGRD